MFQNYKTFFQFIQSLVKTFYYFFLLLSNIYSKTITSTIEQTMYNNRCVCI